MGRYTTVHRGSGTTRKPSGMGKLERRALRAQGYRSNCGSPVDHSMTWSKQLELHRNERALFHYVERPRIGHLDQKGRRLSSDHRRPTTSEHGPVHGRR